MCRDAISSGGRILRTLCLILCCTALCSQTLRAQDPEACSAGLWSSQLDTWCATPFQPADDLCAPGPATTFLGAAGITNTSAAPITFDPTLTLFGATLQSGGAFEDILASGAAALLNASHPDILYPVDATLVAQLLQDTFSGAISYALATQALTAWNSVELIGGCPLACGDHSPPRISCDALLSLECGEIADPPTVTDTQDPNPTLTFVDVVSYGDCLLETTITRTYTATDSCGNTATTVQTIVTTDTIPPALTIPADVQLGCFDPTGTNDTGTATAIDICDTYPLVTFNDEVALGDCPSSLTIERTWTATDSCGNSTSATQTISHTDNTPPALTVPADVTVGCTTDCDDLSTEVGNASAQDDCDPTPAIAYTDTTQTGLCAQERLITRTWTATDACGNSSSATQLISVADETAPELNSPGDVTLSCADPLELAGSPFLLDGCDPSPILTHTDTVVPGNCPNESVIIRNYTATDACGNSSGCTQTITIVDDEAPALYCPVSLMLDCGDDPSTIPLPLAIDNCDDAPTVTASDSTFFTECANSSVIERTYTATDACGNVSTMVQTITFLDQTAPVITCPGVEMVSCGDPLDFLEPATATDNCDPAPAMSVTDLELPGTCPGQSLLVRTWTATDVCGNSSTCTQSIFFLDDTAPALSIPADVTLSCDSTEDTGTATATDACDEQPSVTFSDTNASDGCAQSFTITRTWTATDGCGNESSAVQLIHYVDDLAPVIDCLSQVDLDCTELVSNVEQATATDNCDPAPTLTFADVTLPGLCPQTFTVERTYTAVDDCGNVSTRLQVITVTDSTPPILTIPADTVLSCEEPLTNAGFATATDDCGTATVTSTDLTTPGDCAFEMTIERTWTATDECGNSSVLTQFISVVDNTPPTVTPPADFTINCDEEIPAGLPATATDNCGPNPSVRFLDNPLAGDACGYVVERSWIAVDSCGNTGTAIQLISIVDVDAPVISCPGLVELTCADDINLVPAAVALDNCDEDPSLTFEDNTFPGSCEHEWTVTRTWTATDACGNSSIRFQSISFSDDEAPVIDCAFDVEINCDDDIANVAPATASDNCDDAPTLTSTDVTNAGPCAHTYSVTRTYTSSDACGNVSTHVQTINIVDNQPPTIDCPADQVLTCTDDLDLLELATATDTCDPAPEVTHTDATEPGACPQAFTITRTFTATDACGNESSTTQTITVTDEIAPILTVTPLVELDCTDSVQDVALATATDNCDPAPLVTHEDVTVENGCPQSYTITRTFTATDACLNASTAVQTIIVTDSEAPTISCLATVFLDCPQGLESVADATATDNCDSAPALVKVDVMTPGACPQEYTVVRTWTATDACGNATELVQTITVSDDEAPILSIPEDVTIACGDDESTQSNGTATATDACDGQPLVEFEDSIFATSCPQERTIERTWTATDACGNATSAIQTITILDTLPPVIDCAFDVEISCDDDIANVAPATASDNCDDAPTLTSTDVTNAGPCAHTYSVTRTYTSSDACGNVSTHVQTINIVDNQPPTIDCPADQVLTCTDDLDLLELATATDTCDPAPEVTHTDATEPGACPQAFTITRTFTATDACGNESSTTQTITVTDEIAPILTVTPLVELDCTDSVQDVALATATDNCDPAPLVTHEDVTVENGCPQSYTITRTFTATDACLNASTAVQTIIVTDSEAPTISCLATVFLDCPQGLESVADATATDNCDSAPALVKVDVMTPGACPQEYTVVRTWTATDACGNATELVQTITVSDDEAPILSIPEDVTIACGDDESTQSNGTATATDACDGQPLVEFEDSIFATACPQDRTIERTWTATDACGNATSAIQTITVLDTLPPIIECGFDVVLNCHESRDAATLATATDNCDEAPVITSVDVITPGACDNSFTIARTYTAVDACGNSSTHLQTITVIDVDPPIIDCPDTVTLACTDDHNLVPNATATDNCEGPITVTFTFTTEPGACAQESTVTRTYTATDACGNSSERTQTIFLIDDVDPILDAPALIELDCADDFSAIPLATASDNCDPNPLVTFVDSDPEGSCPQTYSVERTFTATDGCGNSSTFVQTITVTDDLAPVISCVAIVDLDCSELLGDVEEATATDNCDDAPLLTFEDVTTPGSCDQNYTITRTYTATDACLNSSTKVQTINFSDTTAPVLTTPADLILPCGSDTSQLPPATATDDCCAPTVTMEVTMGPGSCPQETIETRTFTAEDACGNSSTSTQTVTLIDDQPPVLTCPADLLLSCEDELIDLGEATATDGCDLAPTVTFADVTTAGLCPGDSTLTRTWTATDACGNSSECVQTITIADTTPPVIECQDEVFLPCPADLNSVPSATATDLCDAAPVVTQSDETIPGPCAQTYTVARTYTATDHCGNESSRTQFIHVSDEEPPVIDCASDLTIACDDDLNTLAVATATDTCDPAPALTFTDTTAPGTCPQETIVTRLYTATDACGNSSTHTQTITKIDIEAPEITCPADLTLDCGASSDPSNTGTATAVDGCDASPLVTFVDSILATACVLDQTIQRTWTATDACGNSSSCIQMIQLVDETAPEIFCGENVFLSCDADLAGVPPAVATDNCDSAPILVSSDLTTPGACANSFVITRTYTATDACGNSSTHVQTLTFFDTEEPQIDCLDVVTMSCDETVADLEPATATDNCDDLPSISFTDISEPTSCGSTVTRTYTATDACGNSSERLQTIHFVDGTAPELAGMDPIVLDCGDQIPGPTATATDNCDGDPTVNFVDSDPVGTCEHSYTITRTYTAADSCGNLTTGTQTISVSDLLPPVIDCLTIVALDCSESLASVAEATAIDNCDGAPLLTFEDVTTPGSCDQNYTITRTYTATDACLNSSTKVQTITFSDVTPPVLETPAALTLPCGSDTSQLPPATATDDCCTPDVTSVDTEAPGSCAQETIVTRTYTATDACGNTSTSTQTITLIDDTAPTLTCPANLTIGCEDDPNNLTTCGTATADDSCDPSPSLVHSDVTEPGSCAGSSLITRTWTATDACGNAASCTQTITVEDNTPPTIDCPAGFTITCGENAPPSAPAGVTDTCDPNPSVTYFDSPFPSQTSPGPGCEFESILRTWVATDACGNTSSCEQLITVIDDEAPTITCGNVTIECGEDPNALPLPDVYDNCDLDPELTYLDVDTLSGDCPQSFTIVRMWMATDACGNVGMRQQLIHVADTTAPELFGPSDTVIACNEPTLFDVFVSDNCGIALFFCEHETTTPNTVILEPVGLSGIQITLLTTASVTINCTALDECGNASLTSSFVISASCDQACDKTFWYDNPLEWCAGPFSATDDSCAIGTPATTFLDAFEIVDTSAYPLFDPTTTLHEGLYPYAGMFAHMSRQGTAALLNATHPGVNYPVTTAEVRQVMQDAFAGVISERAAKQIFLMWNDCLGGCPLLVP